VDVSGDRLEVSMHGQRKNGEGWKAKRDVATASHSVRLADLSGFPQSNNLYAHLAVPNRPDHFNDAGEPDIIF
jgi:hypothetical protein